MKESNKHLIIAAISTMSAILLYTANTHIEQHENLKERNILPKNEIKTPEMEINLPEMEISFADSVKMLIEQLNIKHPDIVFQQALLETGNFTSDIFKENKNLFGMREVKSRPTTQTGVNRNYGVYESWQMSVIDYALLQAWSCKRMNREQFIEYLRTTYATDSTYIDKLKIPPQ